MKRILLHSTALLFAAFFLVAGTGFNIHRYCCVMCAGDKEQTCLVEPATACCADEAVASHNAACAMPMDNSSDEQCGIERYTVVENTDISPRIAVPAFDMAFVAILYQPLAVTLITEQPSYSLHRDAPPDIRSGRDVLCRKATLLI